MELETLIEYNKPLEVTIKETGGKIKLTYAPGRITPNFEKQMRDEEFTTETLAKMVSTFVTSWDITRRKPDPDKPGGFLTQTDGTPVREVIPLQFDVLTTVPSTLLAQCVRQINEDMNPNSPNSPASAPGS